MSATYAVEVGVSSVRKSIAMVVVVIELVTSTVDTWVSSGFKNSEQNAVALNAIFAGLFPSSELVGSRIVFRGRDLTDFANYWLQPCTRKYCNLCSIRFHFYLPAFSKAP